MRSLVPALALVAAACTSPIEPPAVVAAAAPPDAGPAVEAVSPVEGPCRPVASPSNASVSLTLGRYELAAAAWIPPPPMPEMPPHRPDILATPEPVLTTTGDPKVDAYRAQVINSYASQHGWRPYLVRLLAGICADPAILAEAEAPPRAPSEAVERYLTPERIRHGRQLYREMQGKVPFEGAEVPLEVLLAMWAVASDYGRAQLRYDMLQAQLVRGAYGRLSYPESFEIYSAASIILRGKVERETARAFADGRVGQVRMLPSSYAQWAKDGDGDGRADIWRSRADILRTFNDMMAGTWEPGIPILVEIEPVNLDTNDPGQARLAQAIASGQDISPRYFRRIDGRHWPSETWGGIPIAPFGPTGPTFLLTRNGPSVNVASPFRRQHEGWRGIDIPVAVGLLADAIAGRPAPTRPVRG